MKKVILFYKFLPIADTEAILRWQKNSCEKLNLTGRILISDHGINGTLAGEMDDLKAYIKDNKLYLPFKAIAYKWSDSEKEKVFPKLSVKVRDEIVTFDAASEIEVDDNGIIGGGQHIKPKDIPKLIKEKDGQVVFFDGRNKYEAEVGKFKDAVVTDARHTRDFIPELESGKYDHLKEKTLVTYCTGGIRCEVLSMLMKKRGFQDVYQIDGGIVKYGEEYKDEGLWQGSLYVFDGRMGVKFSEKAEDIGKCIHCQRQTSHYANCANKACNELVLICEDCMKEPLKLYHSKNCLKAGKQLSTS
jgi:UPF0176 protein